METDDVVSPFEEDASSEPGQSGTDPREFVGGLAARIAEEQARLKTVLASGEVEPVGSRADLGTKLDDLQFEVAELREMLQSLRTSLDLLDAEDE